MLPAPQSALHLGSCRLSLRSLALLLAVCAPLALPVGIAAQDASAPATQDEERRIAFEADALEYDSNADVVTASGNVVARSGDGSVRADRISWNRTTGQIVAEGNVRLVDGDGNQLFTDQVELTDELKAGTMANLLLAFRQGGRLAAEGARRDDEGNIVLDRAAYSSCAVIDSEGCPKRPSWRVTAQRVRYDQATDRIHFEGAHLELFGARVLPLPGLTIRADGSATSGVFIPDIGITASNGL